MSRGRGWGWNYPQLRTTELRWRRPLSSLDLPPTWEVPRDGIRLEAFRLLSFSIEGFTYFTQIFLVLFPVLLSSPVLKKMLPGHCPSRTLSLQSLGRDRASSRQDLRPLYPPPTEWRLAQSKQYPNKQSRLAQLVTTGHRLHLLSILAARRKPPICTIGLTLRIAFSPVSSPEDPMDPPLPDPFVCCYEQNYDPPPAEPIHVLKPQYH